MVELFRFKIIFVIVSSDLCPILSNLRAVQSGSQSAKKIYQMFKKWMERARGVSVNTHYFRLLFGRCSQNVVQVW